MKIPHSLILLSIFYFSILTMFLIAYTSIKPANQYEEFVMGLNNLQQKTDVIFLNDSTCDCYQNFQNYMNYFDQLFIDTNWTLESHYRDMGMGGRPLLLAFKKNDVKAEKIKLALQKSKDHGIGRKEYFNMTDVLIDYQDSIDFLSAIHIKSDSGYFQFLVFALLGDQYCQSWHSNYGHIEIITSSKRLEIMTKQTWDIYYGFKSSDIEEILKIDPIPVIEHYKDSVSIRIVTFQPWDGFIERKISITKKWPHNINQYFRKVLFEHDCGIMF